MGVTEDPRIGERESTADSGEGWGGGGAWRGESKYNLCQHASNYQLISYLQQTQWEKRREGEGEGKGKGKGKRKRKRKRESI